MERNNDKNKPAVHSFIEATGSFGASMGISKVVSQIYGLLYISSEPLSLDDMAELLEMSKGNVCMNIKYLEQWEAVSKVWIRGSRKDYYVANQDVKKIIIDRLKDGITRRMKDFNKNIETIESELEKSKSNSDTVRKKIRNIRELSQKVDKFLNFASTFVK